MKQLVSNLLDLLKTGLLRCSGRKIGVGSRLYKTYNNHVLNDGRGAEYKVDLTQVEPAIRPALMPAGALPTHRSDYLDAVLAGEGNSPHLLSPTN
jgi:hypothetical protein